MRRNAWIAILGAAAVMVAGCDPAPAAPCDPCTMVCPGISFCPDGGGGDAGPRDSAMPDAPMGDGGMCPLNAGQASGAACRMGRCAAPLMCPMGGMAGANASNLDGTAAAPLPIDLWPGSMCTQVCDPDAAMDECGACHTCNGAILGGRIRFGIDSMTPGVCRPNCTPSPTGRGGCRDGYACDPGTGTCMEACLSDAQCRYAVRDIDGDGDGDIAFLGDDFPARCDTTTGRCVVMGRAGATAGDPCMTELDCEDNGFCFAPDPMDPMDPFPMGFCSKIFCGPGNECQTGDVCMQPGALFGDASACLPGCHIGGEMTRAQALGTGGGHPECGAGRACLWDGTMHAAATEITGGCFPGEYNAITTYNVGAACDDDSECFSPLGRGRCLFNNDRTGGGICSIAGCNGGAMGSAIGLLAGTPMPVPPPAGLMPSDICDAAGGDICVGFNGGTTTFCLQNCMTGNDCAPGFACAAVLSGGGRLCFPTCAADADCHTGASCRNIMGSACTMADAMSADGCYCSDAMPRPSDAGMPMGDAGMPMMTDAGM